MRKVADCSQMPSEKGCTLAISGEEEDVVKAATQHAVAEHGHQDSPELREQVRTMLKDEERWLQQRARGGEAHPG